MKSIVCQREHFSIVFLLLVTSSAFLFNWQSQISSAIAEPLPIHTMTDAVREELIQIVERQSASWNQGDIAEFMLPYWNDDRLTFSSGGTTKRGWKTTYDNYKKNYPDREAMGKLLFSELETQELGEEAILMLGNWRLDRASPIGGNFSLVWKRINGKWVIVHDHSSELRP